MNIHFSRIINKSEYEISPWSVLKIILLTRYRIDKRIPTIKKKPSKFNSKVFLNIGPYG